jgi:F-type H+-transporting ATPase subunit b
VIQEGIENAERAKRDLAEATARAEQVLLEARRQAQETIANAAKAAEAEAIRILKKMLALGLRRLVNERLRVFSKRQHAPRLN